MLAQNVQHFWGPGVGAVIESQVEEGFLLEFFLPGLVLGEATVHVVGPVALVGLVVPEQPRWTEVRLKSTPGLATDPILFCLRAFLLDIFPHAKPT